MMEWWRVALALALPWLTGALGVRALWRGAAPAGIGPLALGYGGLLGLLAATLLLRAQAALGSPLDFVRLAGVWIVLAILSAGLFWRRRSLPGNAIVAEKPTAANSETLGAKILFFLLLAWLALRFSNLALEVWWRPLYPWDAWSTWMVRSRVWSELGQLAPFVDAQRWLADATTSFYALDAWNYPYTVSLLALWPALAYGTWNETAANLPWLVCAVSLGLGFYGQARLWGAPALTALLFTGLLLSLPLLDTHVALAGYADLWLAAVFGLAMMAFFQWARDGDPRQGVLTVLLALACPLIKLEGAVWLLLFIPALLTVRLRGWLSSILAGAAILLGLVWWQMGGVAFAVPGLGEIRLTPDLIQIPYLGRFGLGYRGGWDPVVKNFLVLANWHLFGYLLVVAIVLALVELHRQFERWLLMGLVFVIFSLLALFVLFFLTDAQRWAEQYTSINRIVLDFIPAFLFWILTVFQRSALFSSPSNTADKRSTSG